MTAPVPYQATCVAIGGRGLMIEGPSGSGKSSLALALIDRGATLIGDDGLLIARDGHAVWASSHPNIAGKLEIRNVGVVDLPVAAQAPIALVVRLEESAPRYVEIADRMILLDCALPLIRLFPGSAVLALRAEWALSVHGLPT